MWSILALGAVERIIHQVIDLDAITRIQLNQLQGQLLRVVIDHPQLSVDVFFDENKKCMIEPFGRISKEIIISCLQQK